MDNELRLQLIKFITSIGGVKELNSELTRIATNKNEEVPIMLAAFDARIMTNPELSSQEFKLILELLLFDSDALNRQTAAKLLSSADLNNSQIIEVLNSFPSMDLALAPSLIDVFTKSNDDIIGEAVVNAMKISIDYLDNLTEEDVEDIFSNFSTEIQKQSDEIISFLI